MNKLWEAEILSENKTKLRITTSDNLVIEGYSRGIEPGFDEEGEELDYDVLVFETDDYGYTALKNEDIIKVEKAS